MGEPVIIVDGVSKQYRRYPAPRKLREWAEGIFKPRPKSRALWALKNVSCQIAPGKMVGLLGKNGAGKSTLLRMIGGVGRPDAGLIKTRGTIRALLDLGSGMNPDLTGTENTYLMGVIGGLTRREVRERFDSIVDFAELEDFIDSPVRTYSTGMLMRLAFAIAVQTDPQILLVDEVLAVGDLAFQRKCLDRIRQIKEQGCAILLVTHDSHLVRELCDEALWLRGGEMVAYGPAEIIVARYVAEMSLETQRLTALASSEGNLEAAGGLKLGVNRFGSGEMKITRFRLLNQFGAEITVVEGGEPVTIEIFYEAPTRRHAPIFNASISDSNFLMLIDINTDEKQSFLPDLEGVGKINLRIDRLDLRAGQYHISVGVYENTWSHAYDYHWRTLGFEVRTGPRQAGLIQVPHQWSLTTDKRKTDVS